MRVVTAYLDHYDTPGLHRDAARALDLYAPGSERYLLNKSPDAYWTMLAQIWSEGETFLNVEQDVEIHEDVIPQLEACPELWCLFPYMGGLPPGTPGDGMIYVGLGCTRFRDTLLAAEPTLMVDLPVRGWQLLDCHIHPKLIDKGYAPHRHEPVVKHHHTYTANGVRWCACGGHAQ